MRHEDLAHLSTEALIDIRETASQILEARNVEMLKVALSELTTLIYKWDEKGVDFYICTNDGTITLYANDICVERK